MANKELVDAVKKVGKSALAEYRAKRPKEQIDFIGAILPEVDFSDAPLYDVNLSGAYLRGANLKNADLRLSVLNGTVIENADFSGAVCGRTTFVNLELAKAHGVEKILFEAPCEIGTSTFFAVEDKNVRKNLLRGMGVSNDVAERLIATSEQPRSVRSAFVAFLRKDGANARWVTQKLEAAGIRTWSFVIDQPKRLLGFREITTHIRAEDWVVFLASESSMQNEYVDKFIEKLIQIRKLQPLALDKYISLDWEHAMRNDMMQLRIVPFYDATTDELKDAAAQKLITAIRRGVMEHL